MKVGVTGGMGVVAVVCAAGTGYVAFGGTIPSTVLIVVGTVLTMFFALGATSGATVGSE